MRLGIVLKSTLKCHVLLLNLQQPPLSLDHSILNLRLPEALSDVPHDVLLDDHLEVHLEVLTFSDHT